MGIHRNSQKRIYRKGAIYFVTTNTHGRYPYFTEDVLCELLIHEFHLCQMTHEFALIAYKINPDHMHLMFQPRGKSNYSAIMHYIKRNSSQNINKILFNLHGDMNTSSEGGDAHSRLHSISPSPFMFFEATIVNFHSRFITKYGIVHPYPKFQWQLSFHDHIIRDYNDLHNHIQYIKRQWIKHGLDENNWCFVDSRFDDSYA
jgi:REP element-mobilizing transposase RayT